MKRKKMRNLILDALAMENANANGESENVFGGYTRRRVGRKLPKPKPERKPCEMPTPKSKSAKPSNTTIELWPKTVLLANGVGNLAIPKAGAALTITALSDYN
jgi:hypothetical protein